MLVLDFLTDNPAAFVATCFLLGLVVGSFLNVLIHRLPVMLERQWRADCAEVLGQAADNETHTPYNLWSPRSHCPRCSRQIRALENIPVLSYLMLKGRCAGCGTRISLRYPLVEITTGALSLIVAWHYGFGWQAGAALVLTWGLIALSVIDFDTQLLPDALTLPLLWAGIGLGLAGLFVPLDDSVIGAMAGYLSLWLVFHAFRLLTGKEGMGYGDFKLLAVFGAWLGWQSLALVVLLSSLVGAVVGVTLVTLRGRDRNLPIPFGPYIAAAGWIALLWGDAIIAWYLNSTGIE